MAARRSIRGAGVDRPGPTDTTMLMWKTIEANPGISRQELFARLEHAIPAGWAQRKYANYLRTQPKKDGSTLPVFDVGAARRYLLRTLLRDHVVSGTLSRQDDGGYRVLRPLRGYRGDIEAIDASGTAAAEHMNTAMALQAVIRFRRRNSSRMTAAELEALDRVIEAMRSRCTCEASQ